MLKWILHTAPPLSRLGPGLLAAGSLEAGAVLLGADISPSLPDQSQHHFFHPTPRMSLRELSTDRPDQTESPYTVDAGHFQIEMDFFNYTHDRRDGTTTDTLATAPFSLKVGLLHQVDLHWVLDPYVRERSTDGAGQRKISSGLGDMQTRLKVNLWGNDGGVTALALMPYVKWPTARHGLGNGAFEGGLLVPLGISLGERLGLGLMPGIDFLRNEQNRDYHASLVNSITLGMDLTAKVGAYIEFYTMVDTRRIGEWQGQFDAGITYGLTDNVQLDAGVNIGVTRSAPDWQPFAGLSWRF